MSKYYLITSEEYDNYQSFFPVSSLDGTLCIIEIDDDSVVPNSIQVFNDSNEVNAFRFAESEWPKWMTQEDYEQ